MMKYAPVGSVSSGTMRPEDLIPTFLDTLRDLDSAQADAFEDGWGDVINAVCDEDGEGSEDDSECVNALFDALGEFAPPYCYFGAHEGDGADYGFWVSWDSLEDDCRSGAVLKINDGAEWPDGLDGAEYVLEVTDHGNATLYTPDHVEVWSVV